MTNPTCENCAYFIQHYIRRGYRYDKVFCGHCKYPRLKHRKPLLPQHNAEPKKGHRNLGAPFFHLSILDQDRFNKRRLIMSQRLCKTPPHFATFSPG